MKLLFWNVEGLSALRTNSPDTDIFLGADILVFAETLITDESFGLEGYYSFVQTGERATMGSGIGVFVKPHLNPSLISKSENHVAVRTSEMDVIGCYFRPETPVEEVAIGVAEAAATLEPNGHENLTIIVGDFNCRIDEGERGITLIEVLRTQFQVELRSAPHDHTFIGPQGSSTIDLVFSNHRLKSTRLVTSLERRHARLVCTWDSTASPPSLPSRKKRCIDPGFLSTHPSLNHVEPLLRAGAVSAASTVLTETTLLSAPDVVARESHHKPWFDQECSELKRQVLEERGNEGFWAKRRQYKRICREKRLKHEEYELNKRIEDTEVKPWQLFVNKKRQTAAPVALRDLEEHYSNLLNPDKAPPTIILPERQEEEEQEVSWFNAEFSQIEVRNAILSSKDKKAAGPDRLTWEHLKGALPVLLPLFTLLFNSCLKFACTPTAWRNSVVVSLYKGKGSPAEPGNYRGIALLSVVFKLLTKMLNWRIMRHIGEYLPPEQHGFRPGKGTREAIDILLVYIKNKINAPRGKAYAAFIDFEKAFDSVQRPKLIDKLYDQFGVRGLTLRLLGNILNTNLIQVSDGLRRTPPIEQTRGVLQGDSLSPTLFLTFVSDLAEALRTIPNLQFLFYADDLVLYSDDPDAIREGLDRLHEWCQENEIRVNTRKTKVMKFRNAGRLARTDRFWYGVTPLEVCNTYDYLGITLQPSLTFTKHLQRRKAHALAAIGAIKHLPRISIRTALKIFEMKIKPMTTYGLASIAQHLKAPQLFELDKVKSIFLKRALGIHKSASSTLAHEMAETETLVENLRESGCFDFDEAVLTAYDEQREERGLNFCAEFGTTGPAFQSSHWRESHQKTRHFFTRATAHGFHFLMCVYDRCFDPSDSCLCVLCEQPAPLYHIMDCAARGEDSLPDFVRFIEKCQ